MKFCIVNADDFGADIGINRGIAEAHTSGIVTSTSLMVNMPGTEDAVELSRKLPGLGVGLHVNLTNEGGPTVVDLDDSRTSQHSSRCATAPNIRGAGTQIRTAAA